MGARAEDVKTPLAVASYTRDLFEARERDNGSKLFGGTLIFPKTTDLSALHNNALEAAKAEWPGKPVEQWIKEGTIKSPFLDGDGKQGKDQEGNQKPELIKSWFIRCTSGVDYKPKVFDKKRNPVMDVSGCTSGSQVYAVVNAYAWKNDKNGMGISFGVSLVQVAKLAEGDEVLGGGGGPDPDKWLETIDDEGDAPAETKSGEGAAGLFS